MNRPREGVTCIPGPVRLLPLLTPLPLPLPPLPQMRTFHALLLDAARCSMDIPEAKYLKTALDGAQVRATLKGTTPTRGPFALSHSLCAQVAT